MAQRCPSGCSSATEVGLGTEGLAGRRSATSRRALACGRGTSTPSAPPGHSRRGPSRRGSTTPRRWCADNSRRRERSPNRRPRSGGQEFAQQLLCPLRCLVLLRDQYASRSQSIRFPGFASFRNFSPLSRSVASPFRVSAESLSPSRSSDLIASSVHIVSASSASRGARRCESAVPRATSRLLSAAWRRSSRTADTPSPRRRVRPFRSARGS